MARYGGPAGAGEYPSALAVDRAGHVYVTGGERLDNRTSGYAIKRYATLKYTPAGQRLWVASVPESAGEEAEPHALAVDAAGNVYVTGQFSRGTYSQFDYGTVKYAPDGRQLWLARYGSPPYSRNIANDLALDAGGNAHVTGFSDGAIATLKYSTDGTLLWASRFDDRGRFDWGVALALDAAGHVFVTGKSDSDAGGQCPRGMVTLEYDAQGNELWHTRLDGQHPVDCYPGGPVDIHADNAGSVRVTGAIQENFLDYVAAKYTPLHLPGAPAITSAPSSQTVPAGGTATFTVVATGAAPLRYQWLFNASNIPGATNTSLTLSDVAPANAGSYSVAVWNQAGGVFSTPATLSVLTPPVITSEPVSQSVPAGEPASFTVVATGTSPLGYQWQKDGASLSGRTSATLAWTHVRPTDAGHYRVVVSNVVGAVTSAVATLTVLPPLAGPGSLDLTFDPTAGGQFPGITGAGATIWALALQPDGKVIAGGDFDAVDNVPRPGLARFGSDGGLDAAFDPDLAPPSQFSLSALALQPDGKVVVAGYGSFTDRTGNLQSDLVRLLPDGQVDTTFRFFTTSTGGLDSGIRCLALLPNGQMLIGGEFRDWDNGSPNGFARINPDGSLDSTWPRVSLGAGDKAGIYAIALQPDGKILVGGGFPGGGGGDDPDDLVAQEGGGASRYLVRLNADGTADETFQVAIDEEWSCDSYAVQKVAVQADGKILVAGNFRTVNGTPQPGFARLNPDGSLDDSFQLDASWDAGDQVAFFLPQPDGKLVVGGHGIGVVRLNPDGSRDTSFHCPAEYVFAAALQADGQIMIGGGFSDIAGYPITALARLNNDLVVTLSFVRREIAAGGTIRLVAVPSAQISVYAVEDQPPTGWPVTNISHGGDYDASTGKVKFGPFYDAAPRTLSYAVVTPEWGVHCALGVFCFNGQASADGVNSPITGDPCMVLAGYFPADVNPVNQHISIDEVTAYGAAWRHGAPWECHAQGIPINYVTRAGLLWRAGECYAVDFLVTNEPLWWVNCDAPPGGDAQAAETQGAGLPAAQRQMPGVFVPGEPFVITVSVQPATARAYAVEEQCPAGWTVSDLSDGGEFDAVNSVVRWGPFLDNTPRMLTYQTTAPSTAMGLANFAGVISLDGSSQVVAGVGASHEGCRMQPAQPTQSGQFQWLIRGRPGARLLIEASSDLMVWNVVGEVTLGAGPVLFVDPDAAQCAQRFYRGRGKH